jgi:hypothetical protein
MFKNIFKAAKNLVRSPVGQIGLGILAPQLAGASGLLGGIGSFAAKNPALFQAGLGLLGGAKPQDVLRNVALGAATAGALNPRGGVSEFFGMQPQVTQQTQQTLAAPTKFQQMQNQMSDLGRSSVSDVVEGATKGGESFLVRMGFVDPNETDFFKKYSSLLKLGSIGASVAAAALGEDQARMLYDPEKNPYLTGQVKIQDAYTPAGFNQGGGISDFPEKDGMINGPGDGQSDDIPAMLSDGEFVMTKQAVMAAGNGDRKQGTKAMYNIMNSLEDKAKSMGIGRM